MQALMELLALASTHPQTDMVPQVGTGVEYQEIDVDVLNASPDPRFTWGLLIQCVRGYGDWLVLNNKFGKRLVRVEIGGETIAVISMERNFRGPGASTDPSATA